MEKEASEPERKSRPAASACRTPIPPREVTRFTSSGGAEIFRLPLSAFPGLWANAYLVLVEDYRVLIDAGSGTGESNQDLEQGLQDAAFQAGRELPLTSLTHILITHGHLDHVGGLGALRPRSTAQVGVHELDASSIANHEEYLAVASRRLESFLIEAGVPTEGRSLILGMDTSIMGGYRSVPVDFTYEEEGMKLGPFEILHVPGHCPGQVVIRLHDVLFSSDHVLNRTSPHQAPEALIPWTGLGHYLNSLEALRPWSRTVRLTLGGHEAPFFDLEARLDEIRTLHTRRLQEVRDLLVEPLTISQVSQRLFGKVEGYHVLLALEEAGAHVEYLHQRGLLRIDNLSELEDQRSLAPIRFRGTTASKSIFTQA
jgi:glyoxylase-like metal-dependent hydrolase (beta-lactamase superfamily II)